MLKKKKNNEKNTEFIGPVFEEQYRMLLSKNEKLALSYLRRAALLLFPLKPELWENYIALKNQMLKHTRKSRRIKDMLKDMEEL